jgi:hypothetical protein
MYVTPKIHPSEFPRFLADSNASFRILPDQITKLATNIVHNLPYMDKTSIHLLKDVSTKISYQNPTGYGYEYEDSVDTIHWFYGHLFQIDQYAQNVFSPREILYALPDYPLEVIDMIVSRTTRENLARAGDRLRENDIKVKAIQSEISRLENEDNNQACRNELENQMWRIKGILNESTCHFVFLSCLCGDSLKELSLPVYFSGQLMNIIIQHCPNIEIMNLRIKGYDGNFPVGNLSLLKHLKNLKLPHGWYGDRNFDFKSLSSLEELCIDATAFGVFPDLSPLKKLKKLHLRIGPNQLSEDMIEILSSCKTLETLKLDAHSYDGIGTQLLPKLKLRLFKFRTITK